MNSLGLIMVDREMMKKINQSTIEEFEKRGIKVTTKFTKVYEFIDKLG
jgi:hypothetical protein